MSSNKHAGLISHTCICICILYKGIINKQAKRAQHKPSYNIYKSLAVYEAKSVAQSMLCNPIVTKQSSSCYCCPPPHPPQACTHPTHHRPAWCSSGSTGFAEEIQHLQIVPTLRSTPYKHQSDPIFAGGYCQ